MRTVIPLDTGWLFRRGELEHPPARRTFKSGALGGVTDAVADETGGLVAPATAAEIAPFLPAFAPALADSRALDDAWRPVRIPHDARLDEAYQRHLDEPVGYPLQWQGYLPPVVGYYRTTFALQSGDGRWFLDVEGIMRSADLWLNGHHLTHHESGTTGFAVDVTDVLRPDDTETNVLLVRIDTRDPEGWWYEGAGIYRPIRLVGVPTMSIARHGVWVRTEETTDGVEAVLDVTVRNDGDVSVATTVNVQIAGPDGQPLGDGAEPITVASDATAHTTLRLTLPATVERWSPEHPALHRARVSVGADEVELSFGVRSARFTADGFELNGSTYPLRGANLHQDAGAIGIAVPDAVVEHRLRVLKDMGATVVRSAHHQPARALVDLCDRIGMLLLPETRHLSSTPSALEELDELLLAYRSRPSVIAWSLANEELLEGTPTGTRILATLVRRVRRLDPDRATTVAGHHNLDENAYYGLVDVVGYNYESLSGTLARHLVEHPQRAVLATEDGVQPATRGALTDDPERGRLSEYGTAVGPFGREGRPGPEAVWAFYENHGRIAGALVWAGFDYRGEPYPLEWPSIGSHFGVHDSCGFPKHYAWLLRAWFRRDPQVRVLPHWTWPGQEGELVRLVITTNCEEVELLLDGQTLDRVQPVDRIARLSLPYRPGLLTAVGYRDGIAVARHEVETAGAPAGLLLGVPTREGLSRDAAIVTVTVVDAAGTPVPEASVPVTFDVDGGLVLGVGNGDPADHSPDRAARRSTFSGQCLAVIAPTGPDGTRVRVSSPGLPDAWVDLTPHERNDP